MQMNARLAAALELVLIFPAALFMAALVVRQLPLQPVPSRAAAQAAEAIVTWYSGWMWTLWLLLLALPFATLSIGVATLRRGWNRKPATLLAAATTLASVLILAIVVLHLAAN